MRQVATLEASITFAAPGTTPATVMALAFSAAREQVRFLTHGFVRVCLKLGYPKIHWFITYWCLAGNEGMIHNH